jgi:5-methylcytosine-specific restriction endonuclease McrA
VTCDACGEVTLKHPSTKYAHRFCSLACRDYFRHGPASCLLIDRPQLKVPARTKPERFRPEMRDCAWCGSPFTAARQAHVLCSQVCKVKAKRMRRRSRTTKAGGTYTWAEVMRIFLNLGRACAYCDQAIDGDPDPDHVVPISRGGSNSITNILPACRSCNSDKRDLLLSEWVEDRKRRGLEPRMTSWNQNDMRARHLAA